jgi:hypothetical protein
MTHLARYIQGRRTRVCFAGGGGGAGTDCVMTSIRSPSGLVMILPPAPTAPSPPFRDIVVGSGARHGL